MYKYFTEETKNNYEFKSHRLYELDQDDLTRYQFLSESNNSTSTNYYNFARINFYLSGSDIAQNNPLFDEVFTIGRQMDGTKIFLNKFYDTGSFVSIPQSHFGDRIKRSSFTLTDNSTSATIKIIDDGNGNLYAPNASFSQSVSALSSSDNYVGNIFYDIGAFTITETASFNGSVNYSDVTSGNYGIKYKGTNIINTYEWTCEALPNELNNTENITAYHTSGLGKLKDNLTSSIFPTYITEIGLYDDDQSLVAYAKLSKPIPKSIRLPMRFFVRMDH